MTAVSTKSAPARANIESTGPKVAPDDEAGERDEYVMVGYGLPEWAYAEGRRRRTHA
jgi:hypothetical protein